MKNKQPAHRIHLKPSQSARKGNTVKDCRSCVHMGERLYDITIKC